MSIDQIIRLINILAWPATVLLLCWLLRKPLRRLIPLIHRIKYGDVEIEFSKKLADVAADVGESPLLTLRASGDLDRIYALIDISPASAVVEAWKGIEHAAKDKVQQLLPKDETYNDPLRRPIDYLDYKGALLPSVASAVRDLRMLRNQAAHSRADDISREDALQYTAVAKRVQTRIEAIDELPVVKLSALTLLILELNHLIDSGKHDDITIKDVYQWINQEAILPSLKERTGPDSDLSMFGKYGPYANFLTYYHEQMKQLAEGYAGDHRRKWGVENLGLCLLLAWTNELVQHGVGWHPREM